MIIATTKWNLVRILNRDLLILSDYKTSHFHGGFKGLVWTPPTELHSAEEPPVRNESEVPTAVEFEDIAVSWGTGVATNLFGRWLVSPLVSSLVTPLATGLLESILRDPPGAAGHS